MRHDKKEKKVQLPWRWSHRRKREKGAAAVSEVTLSKNFPNLSKDIEPKFKMFYKAQVGEPCLAHYY